MSDAQSEAEKIRNKRLARLGGGAVQSSAAPAVPTTSEAQNGSSSTATAETPAQLRQPDPPKPQPEAAPSPVPIPVSTPKITISSRTSTPADPSRPKPASRPSESLETWTDRTLISIFRITLKQDQTRDSQGNPLIFVPDVKSELEQTGLPARVSLDNLEQAILEAGSNAPSKKPLAYLLGCWKRITRATRAFRGETSDPKYHVLGEARRLCMSYCIFATTMPEMFNLEPTGRNPLAEHLLNDPENDAGICRDFLDEAVLRFQDDDTIKEAFVLAVEQISEDLSKLDMNGDYKPHVNALRGLVRYKTIVHAITESPKFCPKDIEPQRIEFDTIMGPYFALTPLKAEVASNFFAGVKTQGQQMIQQNQTSVRMSLRAHQEELFDITNLIIKSAQEPRERFLDWFALCVNKNHKRRATWVEKDTTSSDGFMVNVTVMLDRLCEPFMDTTFSKIDRIDVDYLRRNPRVVISDETKINADQQAADDFYAQEAGGKNNFISEVFFLTVAAHHYGTEAAEQRIGQIQREIKHLTKELAKLEAERPKYVSNPAQLEVFDRHVKRYRDHLEKINSIVFAIQAVLLDEISQARSMLFMRYVIAWLLRLVRPDSNYPKSEIELPLPDEQPLVFRALPEYFMEDIVDNFKFTTMHIPHTILTSQCEELVHFCVSFLRSSNYIKNPYLKSGLVSILFHGTWPVPGRPKGILGDILNSSSFCTKHLLHSLMTFYIEAETTGGHNQFYDKFNIRYEIFQVIKNIWSNTVYRDNLDAEAHINVEFFIRFVNMLLNDVTYLLDETFNSFTKIHRLQEELENPQSGLDETQRQEKQEQLDEFQARAKSTMSLGNETVATLKMFTEVLAPAFTMPEVVQRLADMLDYNLETMVGPKQGTLKVRDPQTYRFNPIALLSDIMDVYLNLKDQPNFHLAVARDGRSYKPYNLEHAAVIMQKKSFKSPEELADWRKLAAIIAATKEAEEQAEEDLGEIPDEYLDPLMYTLMEDPVILPLSRTTIDRSTIRSHLLSDPNDPFNRQPLKIEDVIPNTELREKIDAFRAAAKQRRVETIRNSKEAAEKAAEIAEAAQAAEADTMDES